MKGFFLIITILAVFFTGPSFAEHKKHPIKHKKVVRHHHKTVPKKKVHAPQINNSPNVGFVSSIKQSLVQFVHNSVSTLSYSAYKMGGSHFDPARGIYIVDCSGYVDNTLRAVYPNAYLSLVNSSGTYKPNSMHYYNFFQELSQTSNEYWSRIEDIEELRPGDILVFRKKKGHKRTASGHVMVVMNKPMRDGDIFWVSVADSAPEGHSQDTRSPRLSGIGIGTLLLRIDPYTRQPSAYAWKIGSRWRGDVTFAMARPLEQQMSNNFFSPWNTLNR